MEQRLEAARARLDPLKGPPTQHPHIPDGQDPAFARPATTREQPGLTMGRRPSPTCARGPIPGAASRECSFRAEPASRSWASMLAGIAPRPGHDVDDSVGNRPRPLPGSYRSNADVRLPGSAAQAAHRGRGPGDRGPWRPTGRIDPSFQGTPSRAGRSAHRPATALPGARRPHRRSRCGDRASRDARTPSSARVPSP